MAKKKSSGTGAAGIGGLIIIIIIVLAGFLGVDIGDLLETVETGGSTTTRDEPVVVTNSQGSDGWYEIYFTNPSCPPEEERRGGVDEIIAQDITAAQNRVDIASFDLDSVPMIDALIELEGRGVEVRVVVDNEHTPEGTINRLRRNGISVVVDDRSALMHNKFVVIDGRYLWMGSMNFSSNGVYCNNNNLVRFDSPELAANYTTEMDEMYIERAFGPTSPQNTNIRFTINGINIENYFSSEDEISAILARTIARADSEILFMAFSFTQEDIGEAMLERAEAGVTVRGVFETSGSETSFSYYGPLNDAGFDTIQVRQDGNPRIMHHKVIIIDRSVVVFGSYNFSGSAEDSNDENTMIIYDPEFASYFVEEFETVWGEAKTN